MSVDPSYVPLSIQVDKESFDGVESKEYSSNLVSLSTEENVQPCAKKCAFVRKCKVVLKMALFAFLLLLLIGGIVGVIIITTHTGHHHKKQKHNPSDTCTAGPHTSPFQEVIFDKKCVMWVKINDNFYRLMELETVPIREMKRMAHNHCPHGHWQQYLAKNLDAIFTQNNLPWSAYVQVVVSTLDGRIFTTQVLNSGSNWEKLQTRFSSNGCDDYYTHNSKDSHKRPSFPDQSEFLDPMPKLDSDGGQGIATEIGKGIATVNDAGTATGNPGSSTVHGYPVKHNNDDSITNEIGVVPTPVHHGPMRHPNNNNDDNNIDNNFDNNVNNENKIDPRVHHRMPMVDNQNRPTTTNNIDNNIDNNFDNNVNNENKVDPRVQHRMPTVNDQNRPTNAN